MNFTHFNRETSDCGNPAHENREIHTFGRENRDNREFHTFGRENPGRVNPTREKHEIHTVWP